MGITIHYKFQAKDRKTAEKIIAETAKKADQLKKQFPKLETRLYSPTEILVDYPECESLHLNFEPLKKKMEACSKKNPNEGERIDCWEAESLHATTYETESGKIYKEYPPEGFGGMGWIKMKPDWTRPLLGTKAGYQTANFTKTEYCGLGGHVIMCELLEPAKKYSSKKHVDDEADFCGDEQGKKRAVGVLQNSFGESRAVLQAVFGKLKSAGFTEENIGGSAVKRMKKEKM